jgi:hypothetical protein
MRLQRNPLAQVCSSASVASHRLRGPTSASNASGVPTLRFSALLCLAVLAGCGQRSPAATEQVTPTPASADPFAASTISAACGGGVAGGGSGVTLTPDHHLISWDKSSATSPRIEIDAGADDVFSTDVRRQLNAVGFAGIDFNQPGNMTCSLTVDDHAVAWPQGDAHAPAGAVAVQELLMRAGGAD